MENIPHQRNSNLDIIRILAAAAVVMIHCGAMFVADYLPQSWEFRIANDLECLSQLGVPLFVMISGALFLDERRQVTFRGMLSKNVKSLAIVTVLWAGIFALLYQIAFPLLTGEAISVDCVIRSFLDGYYHMWYLYMILGLYMITPFLKKFVCKQNKAMVLSFIVISATVQFLLPTADVLLGKYLDGFSITTWVGKFNLGFFNGYIAYFLIGWYIAHVGIRQRWLKRSIYVLGVGALAAMICHGYFAEDYNQAYINTSVFVLIYSVSVFLALCSWKVRLKERTVEKLARISKLTFGVYMIHPILLGLYQKAFPYSQHPAIYILVCFVAVAGSSFLAAYVVSKIPVIKKLIKVS